jgi:hypothetical protein
MKKPEWRFGLGTIIRYILYRIILIQAHLMKPWVKARFFIAWDEYRQFGHYRERLQIDFRFAFEQFLESNFEQRYLLKRRFEREPHIWWSCHFAPWTIEMPALLETAAAEGLFTRYKYSL